MKRETQLSVLKEIRDLLKGRVVKFEDIAHSLPVSATPNNVRGTRTIHIAKGLTIEAALAECKKLFPVWRWDSEDLDKIVMSERTSEKAYSITFKNVVEADEENANKSASDLEGLKGITLLERIVMELDYFRETGEHLDVENVTLCSGSRHSDGYVPSAHWFGGKFGVGWYGADSRDSSLRARVAVS